MYKTILAVFIDRLIKLFIGWIQDYFAHRAAKKKLKLRVKEIRETIKDPKDRAAAINDLLS